jgi:hypothetical protein
MPGGVGLGATASARFALNGATVVEMAVWVLVGVQELVQDRFSYLLVS